MTNTPTPERFKVEPRGAIHGYELVNAAHLPDTEDRKPLVEDFLFNTDTMLLFAPAGGYKSMVALHLAVAVANGGTFMGKQAHQGRVLFVDGELSAYSFKQRFELFGNSENLDILSECYQPPEKLGVLPPIHLEKSTPVAGGRKKLSPGAHEEERGWQGEILTLTQLNGYALVVFDNVRTLTGDIDENDAADIAPLNTLVKRLRHHGCAVLVIHHTRKAKDEGGLAVFAGSSNLLTVYNTALGIETPCSGVISFEVHKDRENSIGDYFRETAWTLEGMSGFRQVNAHERERSEMARLMSRIHALEFTTKGEICKAARKQHGLSFRGSPGDFKGLHAKLEAEDICRNFTEFDKEVKGLLARAQSGDAFSMLTNNQQDDF